MNICCGHVMWKTQLSCGEHLFNVVDFMLWTTPICCGCMLWRSFYMLWIICCPQHEVLHVWWVTYTCVVDNMCCGWHVVDNTYLCCGEHVHKCCPQHIYVLHNIWYVVEHIHRFSLCSPQHTPTTYNVLHNIHPQYMFLYMLWVHVVENNPHMLWSTNLYICCGVQRLLPMYKIMIRTSFILRIQT